MDAEPGWEKNWVRENGLHLRKLREERQISRKQLADGADVNVSQVSRVERGRDARISTILKIFAGLGYRVRFDAQETCEEIGEFLNAESWRRQERVAAGLRRGKRWRW